MNNNGPGNGAGTDISQFGEYTAIHIYRCELTEPWGWSDNQYYSKGPVIGMFGTYIGTCTKVPGGFSLTMFKQQFY